MKTELWQNRVINPSFSFFLFFCGMLLCSLISPRYFGSAVSLLTSEHPRNAKGYLIQVNFEGTHRGNNKATFKIIANIFSIISSSTAWRGIRLAYIFEYHLQTPITSRCGCWGIPKSLEVTYWISVYWCFSLAVDLYPNFNFIAVSLETIEINLSADFGPREWIVDPPTVNKTAGSRGGKEAAAKRELWTVR